MGADNWCTRNTLLRIQWQAIKLSLELAPHLGQGNWKSQNISRIWRDSSSRHKFDIFLYLKIVNMATLFGDLDVFFSNFFLCVWVYSLTVCLYSLSTCWCLWKPGESTGFPRTRVTGGCWEMNPCPLEEQQCSKLLSHSLLTPSSECFWHFIWAQ